MARADFLLATNVGNEPGEVPQEARDDFEEIVTRISNVSFWADLQQLIDLTEELNAASDNFEDFIVPLF